MARIRSLKPEAFASETLAEVSVHAERTFLGLTTQVDDNGRFRDNAKRIRGLLWSQREEVTTADVEEHLAALAAVGLVCRYTGCDGHRYLHLPTFHKHQRIDRPTVSKASVCRAHHNPYQCEVCGSYTCASVDSGGAFVDGREPTAAELEEMEAARRAKEARRRVSAAKKAAQTKEEAAAAAAAKEPAGRKEAKKAKKAPQGDAEPADAAPGAQQQVIEPDPDTAVALASEYEPATNDLIAEHIDVLGTRPPDRVVGSLCKQIKGMLKEGIDAQDVRDGLAEWRSNPRLGPAALPSCVDQVIRAKRSRGGSVVALHSAASKPSTGEQRLAQGMALVAELRAEEAAAEAQGGGW